MNKQLTLSSNDHKRIKNELDDINRDKDNISFNISNLNENLSHLKSKNEDLINQVKQLKEDLSELKELKRTNEEKIQQKRKRKFSELTSIHYIMGPFHSFIEINGMNESKNKWKCLCKNIKKEQSMLS